MPSPTAELIERAFGELGAAIAQQTPSDDAIIMEHVKNAHSALKQALNENNHFPLSDEDAHTISQICMAIECEGDRSFFGSTNDADDLKHIAGEIDEWCFRKHRPRPPARPSFVSTEHEGER